MKYIVCFGLLLLSGFTAYGQIRVIPNGDTVERYGIYELTIVHDGPSYENPWEEVDVSVQMTHDARQTFNIDGFYYRDNLWKVRFSPPAVGVWTWTLIFTTPTDTFTASGSFQTHPSDRPGFVRRHPTNPFRLVFADGSLFNALGIGDCILDVDGDGNPLNNWGFDGEFHGPDTPVYGWVVDMPIYMEAYGARGAGFNVFRWSIDNCAFKLWQTISTQGNYYGVQEGLWGDELVDALRMYGFRIWLTFFNEPPFLHAERDPAEQAAIQRYMRYVVARYGAYVDIWELMNETDEKQISPEWIAFAVNYLHSLDPYDRLISTSWERPERPDIDIDAPHWWERESEFASDLRTVQRIAQERRWNKPIIFAEQSNEIQNWDERSALRMRLRSWTAFFEEGVLIFWNSSFAKDLFSKEGSANLYIGPEERAYVRVLQHFTSDVDADVRRFTLRPQDPDISAYGLRSSQMILGYFHHFGSHSIPINTSVVVNIPADATVVWVEPESGVVLSTFLLERGTHTLFTPDFVVDLALKIRLDTK